MCAIYVYDYIAYDAPHFDYVMRFFSYLIILIVIMIMYYAVCLF